jgi:hypothetical protein
MHVEDYIAGSELYRRTSAHLWYDRNIEEISCWFNDAIRNLNHTIRDVPDEFNALIGELLLFDVVDDPSTDKISAELRTTIAQILVSNLNYKNYKFDHSTVYVYLDVLISLGYKRLSTYIAQTLTRQLVVIELIADSKASIKERVFSVKGPYNDHWIKWRRSCPWISWNADNKHDSFTVYESGQSGRGRICEVLDAIKTCHAQEPLIISPWGVTTARRLEMLASRAS